MDLKPGDLVTDSGYYLRPSMWPGIRLNDKSGGYEMLGSACYERLPKLALVIATPGFKACDGTNIVLLCMPKTGSLRWTWASYVARVP